YGAEGVGLLRALLGLPCLRAVVAPMGKVRLSPDAPGQLPAWQRVIAPALEAVRLGQPVAPALADALAALEADARIAPLGWAPFTCWRR
ncbi:MAG: hypothetical protein KC613_24345, partial [Myxococcales bacterium]|nr:hypothetical protein [Myxococcales bacterium]